MIRLLPHTTRTLVVAEPWHAVAEKIALQLSKPVVSFHYPMVGGWIKNERFHLVIRLRRHQAFQPVIKGKIEPTSLGCLIFLDYALPRATRLFLLLWTLFLLFLGIIVGYQYNDLVLGLAFVVIIIFIHVVAWSNFKLHIKPSHNIFLSIIE